MCKGYMRCRNVIPKDIHCFCSQIQKIFIAFDGFVLITLIPYLYQLYLVHYCLCVCQSYNIMYMYMHISSAK